MLTKPASLLSEKTVTVENRTVSEIDLLRTANLVDFLRGELGIAPATSVDVTFVDEGAMAQLHLRYMGLPGPTDVLSFPSTDVIGGAVNPTSLRDQPILGDIIICPAFIASYARSGPTQMNIDACVIHAMLHLVGHNHEQILAHAIMSAREELLFTFWTRAETLWSSR